MSEASRKRALEAEEPDPIAVAGPVNIRNVALSVLAAIGVILMLQYMEPVFIPLALGILISYALWPIVKSLERVKVPRAIGAGVAVGLFVAALGFTFYTFSDEAMQIVRDVPPAARALREQMRERERRSTDAPQTPLEEVQKAATEIDKAAAQASQPTVETRGVQKVEVVPPPFRISDHIGMGSSLLNLGGQFVVILFLIYFLLVTGDLFKRKLVKIAGPTLTKKRITVQILDEISQQIERFIMVQVFTSALVATATALALWWFGVEHFVVWGLLAGILNSIPYLGPVAVSGGLAVIAYMQFNDIWQAAYVAAVAMVITSLEGFLLTPALLSRAAQMNPAAIFVGLLFWTWVWGIWGTVLAVPMMMMIKAVCDHIEELQPIGELLGD